MTRLDVVNAFLAATTAAAFLGYRVSGVPALRLMGFGGCLLLFRALPEFLGSVMAILVFGWAWARIVTVDYQRFMRARPVFFGKLGLGRFAGPPWQPPRVTLRRSIGASAVCVCIGLLFAYLRPQSLYSHLIIFGGAGIEILVAHLVYFGLRDEPRGASDVT